MQAGGLARLSPHGAPVEDSDEMMKISNTAKYWNTLSPQLCVDRLGRQTVDSGLAEIGELPMPTVERGPTRLALDRPTALLDSIAAGAAKGRPLHLDGLEGAGRAVSGPG